MVKSNIGRSTKSKSGRRLLVRFSQAIPDFDMATATDAEMEAGMEALSDGISSTMEGRAAVEDLLRAGGIRIGRPEVSSDMGGDVLLELVYTLPPPDKTVDVVIKHLKKFFREKLPHVKGVEFKAI